MCKSCLNVQMWPTFGHLRYHLCFKLQATYQFSVTNACRKEVKYLECTKKKYFFLLLTKFCIRKIDFKTCFPVHFTIANYWETNLNRYRYNLTRIFLTEHGVVDNVLAIQGIRLVQALHHHHYTRGRRDERVFIMSIIGIAIKKTLAFPATNACTNLHSKMQAQICKK